MSLLRSLVLVVLILALLTLGATAFAALVFDLLRGRLPRADAAALAVALAVAWLLAVGVGVAWKSGLL